MSTLRYLDNLMEAIELDMKDIEIELYYNNDDTQASNFRISYYETLEDRCRIDLFLSANNTADQYFFKGIVTVVEVLYSRDDVNLHSVSFSEDCPYKERIASIWNQLERLYAIKKNKKDQLELTRQINLVNKLNKTLLEKKTQ